MLAGKHWQVRGTARSGGPADGPLRKRGHVEQLQELVRAVDQVLVGDRQRGAHARALLVRQAGVAQQPGLQLQQQLLRLQGRKEVYICCSRLGMINLVIDIVM